MHRMQLLEIEDQPWVPAPIRNAMTGGLRVAAQVFGHADAIAAHLAARVEASGCTQLIDLCAGGGGPTIAVLEALRARGIQAKATLTDLFPNLAAFQRIKRESGGLIDHVATPVDATAVPPELRGFRLVFNAFHHLPPAVAGGVLRDAMVKRQPIAIYEIVGRDPLTMAALLGAPLFMLGAVPFLRPFDWRWLPWTYLVPAIPFFSAWDGLVSCMRIYDPDELRAMVAPLDDPGWRWEIGRFRMAGTPTRATWLWGIPVN